jgi:membrane protein YqaA with SNARE-associated domain
LRRLYDWVIAWAEHPSAQVALFGISFAESSFFPIPPDPLLVAMGVSQPKRVFRFALNCTIASVLGAMLGYLIGYAFWVQTQEFFFSYVFKQAHFETVRDRFEDWRVWAVFGAAFTPIPFKVFTIAAGVFGSNFPLFVAAATAGRGLRFFLEAAVVYKTGDRARDLIDRHFNLLAILFFLLLIGGFAVVKYVL